MSLRHTEHLSEALPVTTAFPFEGHSRTLAHVGIPSRRSARPECQLRSGVSARLRPRRRTAEVPFLTGRLTGRPRRVTRSRAVLLHKEHLAFRIPAPPGDIPEHWPRPTRFNLQMVQRDDITSLERAVVAQAPPGAVVIGASVSPDGVYGATLTYLPSANYLMDDVFTRDGDRWELHSGGSGGGLSWTSLGDETGVLRYGDEAPASASAARVEYEGREYRVPVRSGHVLFVAWDTAFREDPCLITFE